jgi:hypothetical protein
VTDAILHEGTAPSRPIRLITHYDLKRSRLIVFFRILLAIPHFVWMLLWTIAALISAVICWFATLVQGRPPAGLHGFLARYVRYGVHLNAFLTGAANQFPGFAGAPGSYPIDLHVDPPAPQARVTVFFRIFLALPAVILSSALSGGGMSVSGFGISLLGLATAVAIIGWFASLSVGRMPASLEHTTVYALGYDAQSRGHLMLVAPRRATRVASVLNGTTSTKPPQFSWAALAIRASVSANPGNAFG